MGANRRGKFSCCWKFYNPGPTPAEKICKICRKIVRSGNTSNLLGHIRRIHPKQFKAAGGFGPQKEIVEDRKSEDPHSEDSSAHCFYNQENNNEIQNGEQPSVNGNVETPQTVIILQSDEMDEEALHQQISAAFESSNNHTNPDENHNIEENATSSTTNKPAVHKIISSETFRPIVTSVRGSPLKKQHSPDEFELFGKYIASILRSIPSEKSTTRLQSDIVAMCLKEKVKFCN